MKKTFESYPLLTDENKTIIFKNNSFDLSYIHADESQQLEKKLKEGTTSQYIVRSANPGLNWNGTEDNLLIEGTIVLNELNKLFVEDSKLTSSNNTIGIGINIYSKLSKFNRVYSIGEIKYDQDDKNKEINYKIEIEKGTLSEKVCIDYFLYLKEVNTIENFYARVEGMKFGSINFVELFLEGDGSIFPITQFEDQNEPLWKMQVNYDDLEEDVSLNNLSLQLNTLHKDFQVLTKGIENDNVMVWKEILSGFFTNLLYKIYVDNGSNIDTIQEGVYSEGTIGYFVNYIVSLFEIDKYDFVEITELSNKIRKAIYNLLAGI